MLATGMETTVAASEKMDEKLWEYLPEEVLLIILAKLPLRSSAQFRSVCRSWNSLWYSSPFLQLRSSTPTERAWFIFNNYHPDFSLSDGCFSYNITWNKWHKLTLNVPSQIERVAASAGGLLFCVGRPSIMVMRCAVIYWNWPEMFVCNPLKDSWIKLPQRPGYWQPIVTGMVADKSTKTFKVILANPYQGTEIYNSSSRSWKLVSKSPTNSPLATNNSVSHKGNLLSTGSSALLVFDTKEERWSEVEYPTSAISHPQINECQGRLLLVGFLAEENRVCIWDLQGTDGTDANWSELYSSVVEDFTPVCMGTVESEQFLSRSKEPDDLLCYAKLFSAKTVYDARPIDLQCYTKFVGRVLIYSLSQNSWCLVDKRHEEVKCIGESFRFDPMVEACV